MDPLTTALGVLHGLRVIRIVGHGGEGQVYSATNKAGEYVAIKCLQYGDGVRALQDAMLKMKNESSGWCKIGYETQVLHLESYRTLAFVMPLLDGLSLKQHARIGIPWTVLQGSKMAVLYFEQLVSLHNRRLGNMSPLAHRDMKPSNVMIVERPFRETIEFVPVIIDWGSAHVAKADGSQDKKFPGCPTGSRGYFGPDIYKSKQTYSIDVYGSVPILLHFLRYQGDCSLLKTQIFDRMKQIPVTTDDPFNQERRSDLYERAAKAPFPIVEVAFEFYRSDPEACGLLMTFLTQMQAQQGTQRPTALQCLKFFLRLHEYFFLREMTNASHGHPTPEDTEMLAGVLRELRAASGTVVPASQSSAPPSDFDDTRANSANRIGRSGDASDARGNLSPADPLDAVNEGKGELCGDEGENAGICDDVQDHAQKQMKAHLRGEPPPPPPKVRHLTN